CAVYVFFVKLRRPACSTLFPYTTLFRSVFVDVHVKFFAIALIFPVGDFIAETEEVGIAAKVEIADEHAAEMTKVADFVVTEAERDRKSTRLNSSHVAISYAVFCLKKKIK